MNKYIEIFLQAVGFIVLIYIAVPVIYMVLYVIAAIAQYLVHSFNEIWGNIFQWIL